jgi:CRP/FNR family transcriptional regulator
MNQIINLKTIKPSCADCRLSQMCLPHDFSHQELEQFEEIINHKSLLKKGEFLFKRGQPFKSLYTVRVGSVKAYMPTKNSGEQIVGFYMPGELFGFDAIGHGVHSWTAETLETSSICELSYEKMLILFQQLPAFAKHFMSLMSKEIASEHERMLMLGKRIGDARVANLLINIASRFHVRGFSATQFNLSMSRQDIANYLGLTLETISRCIGHLRDDKVLEVDGRYVRILDMPKLATLAGMAEVACPSLENVEQVGK